MTSQSATWYEAVAVPFFFFELLRLVRVSSLSGIELGLVNMLLVYKVYSRWLLLPWKILTYLSGVQHFNVMQ